MEVFTVLIGLFIEGIKYNNLFPQTFHLPRERLHCTEFNSLKNRFYSFCCQGALSHKIVIRET